MRNLLVLSRVNTENRLGTRACNRLRCKTCRFVSQSCEVKMSRGIFRMTGSFACTSRNLIYVMVCKRCDLVYRAETGRTLSTRSCEHLKDVAVGGPKPVPSILCSPGHQDIEVTLGPILTSNRDISSKWVICTQRE